MVSPTAVVVAVSGRARIRLDRRLCEDEVQAEQISRDMWSSGSGQGCYERERFRGSNCPCHGAWTSKKRDETANDLAPWSGRRRSKARQSYAPTRD